MESTREPADGAKAREVAPSPATVRRPRPLLWLAVVIGGLVVLFAVGLFVAHRRAEATFEEHRALAQREWEAAAARARGRPALLAPTGTGDAGDVIAAFVAAVRAVPASDRERLPAWHVGSDAAPEAEQDAILVRHPVPLATLSALLHVPRKPVPPPKTLEEATTGLDGYWDGRRWLSSVLGRTAARGEHVSARRIATLYAAYGIDAVGGDSMFGSLLAASAVADASRALLKTLPRAPVEADEARRLVDLLGRLDTARPSSDESRRCERMLVRRAIVSHGATSWQLFGPDVDAWSLRRWAGSRRLCAADALRRLDEAFAVPSGAPASWGDDPNPIVRSVVEGLGFYAVASERLAAPFVVARTGFAVAGFFAEHGRVPTSLDELVPSWLARVPLDPMDGQPLRYAAGRVWSVGEDRTDDGGVATDDDAPEDIVAPAPKTRETGVR